VTRRAAVTWRAGVRRAIRIGSRPGPWKRGRVLAAMALLLAAVMLLHVRIPNWGWNLGSLVETFLPWLGLVIPVLLAGPCGVAPPWPWLRWCCRRWCG
jgi:vancomycin resistance protein VanJ